MTAAATALARPYAVPNSGGSGRAIALAVLMHALLAGLLFFGIRWQSSPPAVIQAELWSATPQTAAPAPRPLPPPQRVEPPPEPRVEPKPEPRVELKPEPRVEPKIEPPPPKADIVERMPPKKEPPKKPVPPKVEPRPEPPKAVAKVQPPEPKPAPKPVVKPTPKPAPSKADTRARDELAKLQQQAAGETSAHAPSELNALLAAAGKEAGKDQQTSGPRGDQNGYTAKLQAAIRSQMRYPATATGNPFVKVRIEQLPSGEVVRVTVLKASGVQAFDDAVERAIQAASPLPRPTQGPPPRELELTYNMYDKG